MGPGGYRNVQWLGFHGSENHYWQVDFGGCAPIGDPFGVAEVVALSVVQSAGEAVLVACEASMLALACPLLAASTYYLHLQSKNILTEYFYLIGKKKMFTQQQFNFGRQIFPCFFDQV